MMLSIQVKAANYFGTTSTQFLLMDGREHCLAGPSRVDILNGHKSWVDYRVLGTRHRLEAEGPAHIKGLDTVTKKYVVDGEEVRCCLESSFNGVPYVRVRYREQAPDRQWGIRVKETWIDNELVGTVRN